MMAAGFLSTLDTWGYALMRYLLAVLWQSSLLIVLAWGLAYRLRGQRAALRHALWVLVLLATPFLPLLSTIFRSNGAPQAPVRVLPQYVERTVASEPPVAARSDTMNQAQVQNANPGQRPATPASSSPAPTAPPAPSRPSLRPGLAHCPWALALVVYAAGVALFAGVILMGSLRLHRWIEKALPHTDPRTLDIFEWAVERLRLPRSCRLLAGCQLPVPISAGFVRSCVIMPVRFDEQLNDMELHTVVLHEAAHLARRDPLTLGLAAGIRALFFFHPLVWLVVREVGRLAEHCADEIVLDVINAPLPYAQMLVRMAEGLPPRPPLATAMTTGFLLSRGAFLERVKAILARPGQMRRITFASMGFTLGLFVFSCALASLFPLGERGARKDVDEAIGIVCVTSGYSADAPARIERAVALITRHPQSQTLPALVDWLAVNKDTKRRSAIHLIGDIPWDHPEPALPPLRKLTRHKEDTTRGMACLTLGYLQDKDSFDRIAQVLKSDPSDYARRCAAFALGELGDPRALPILEPMAMAKESGSASGRDYYVYDNAADSYWRLKWQQAFETASPAEKQAAQGIWLIAGSTANEKQRIKRAMTLIKAADPFTRKLVLEKARKFTPKPLIIYYLSNAAQLAEMILAKEGAQESAVPTPRVLPPIKVPGGGTVTLHGVAEVRNFDSPSIWWQPDGTRIREILKKDEKLYPPSLQPANGEVAYLLAFKYQPDENQVPKDYGWTFQVLGGRTTMDSLSPVLHQGTNNGRHDQAYQLVGVCLPLGLTSCTLRVGFANESWDTVANWDPQKKEWIGPHDPALKVKWFGYADNWRRTVVQFEGKDFSINGHNMTRHRDGWQEVQVLAVTKDGDTRIAGGLGSGLNDSLGPFFAFNGKPEEFSKFKFQSRPYHWVSFRNISLVPDLKTSPAVEVEARR